MYRSIIFISAMILFVVAMNGEAEARKHRRSHFQSLSMIMTSNTSLLPHPAGCPRRAFCGCGVSVDVYGHPVRNLYLAANWLRFPRAAPSPGMVGARPGHVLRLREHVSGNIWLVYDPNSGGGRTRLHARSISGYTIVNPLM